MARTFRSPGLPAQAREHAWIKERERGYDEATLVESFAMLNAVGGHGIPWPEAARPAPPRV